MIKLSPPPYTLPSLPFALLTLPSPATPLLTSQAHILTLHLYKRQPSNFKFSKLRDLKDFEDFANLKILKTATTPPPQILTQTNN